MSRKWKIALAIVVVVVVALVAWRMLGGKPGASAGAGGPDGTSEGDTRDTGPVPVTVEPALKQDVPVYLTALGTVTALNTVTINPQVSGRLVSLAFTEGQPVKKGQVLARIDPREFQAAYDQAAASRTQSQAQLGTARATNARLVDPNYRQYVAKTDLDTQKNLVQQYQGAVAASEASMRAAQVQLQYATITSPIDGVAGLRGVDIGNIVSPSTAIVTVTEVNPIYVSFNLPEKDLAQVRAANAAGKVDVSALDRTDSHPIAQDGSLDVIDNQVSATSGTFRLRAVFANADRALWPGQFINVRLRASTLAGGVVVPGQSVQRGPNGDYVYLVQGDNTVRMQDVTSGVEVGDSHVVIATGLKAGDRVVTEGQFRLKPGSKVNPLKPGEVPPGPTDEELKKATKGDRGGGRRGGPR